MHEALVNQIVKSCRQREAEGDCAVTPSPSVEPLESAVIALAGDRDRLTRILDAILETDERGQGVGYVEAMDAARREVTRLKRYA